MRLGGRPALGEGPTRAGGGEGERSAGAADEPSVDMDRLRHRSGLARLGARVGEREAFVALAFVAAFALLADFGGSFGEVVWRAGAGPAADLRYLAEHALGLGHRLESYAPAFAGGWGRFLEHAPFWSPLVGASWLLWNAVFGAAAAVCAPIGMKACLAAGYAAIAERCRARAGAFAGAAVLGVLLMTTTDVRVRGDVLDAAVFARVVLCAVVSLVVSGGGGGGAGAWSVRRQALLLALLALLAGIDAQWLFLVVIASGGFAVAALRRRQWRRCGASMALAMSVCAAWSGAAWSGWGTLDPFAGSGMRAMLRPGESVGAFLAEVCADQELAAKRLEACARPNPRHSTWVGLADSVPDGAGMAALVGAMDRRSTALGRATALEGLPVTAAVALGGMSDAAGWAEVVATDAGGLALLGVMLAAGALALAGVLRRMPGSAEVALALAGLAAPLAVRAFGLLEARTAVAMAGLPMALGLVAAALALESRSGRWVKLRMPPLRAFAAGLACVALPTLIFRLWQRLAFELQGPQTADAPLYWAVGRGIVNGLKPYAELYESKPPGIFLITGASALLGGESFALAVQVTCLLATGLAFWLMARVPAGPHAEDGRASTARAEAIVAAALGCLAALYVASRAGKLQVESFGAAFSSLYLVCAVRSKLRPDWRLTVGAAVALLLGIGTKEPFLLATAAGALLIAESPREWGRIYALPLAIGGAAGVVFMLATGWLEPYVTIHLHEMLSSHVQVRGSPLARGLDVQVLAADLAAFDGPAGRAAVLVGCVLVPALALVEGVWRHRVMKLGALVVATIAVACAVQLGDALYDHHYVVALPLYLAAFAVVLRGLRGGRWARATAEGALIAAAWAAIAFVATTGPLDYEGELRANQAQQAPARAAAGVVDAVLDACGQERWLFLGGNGFEPYAFTRHSPLGPLFMQYPRWLEPRHDLFRREYVRNLHTAGLVVMRGLAPSDLEGETYHVLATEFTTRPWPCAASALRPTPGLQWFFRRDGVQIAH
jgi:hypothetical protein